MWPTGAVTAPPLVIVFIPVEHRGMKLVPIPLFIKRNLLNLGTDG